MSISVMILNSTWSRLQHWSVFYSSPTLVIAMPIMILALMLNINFVLTVNIFCNIFFKRMTDNFIFIIAPYTLIFTKYGQSV